MSGQTRMSVSLSRRLNPESQVLKSRSLSVLRPWLQHAVPLGLDRVHSKSVSLNCALYALFREANAEAPEVKTMEVGTARTRLFKVGALVQATHRRIWFRVASHWPGRDLLVASTEAVRQHIDELHDVWKRMNLFFQSEARDRRDRHRIVFAPLLLK